MSTALIKETSERRNRIRYAMVREQVEYIQEVSNARVNIWV